MTAPVARLLIEKDLLVPMRDGTHLATDVYRPDSPVPAPVLLQRTPYDKNDSSFHNFTLELHKLVQAGYVVVVQDVRGRFGSEGVFDPLVDDGRDGADTVSWIVEQEWANGRVGMFGASYYGANQWQTANADSRVTVIAPGVCSSDFHQGWVYEGGAFQLGLNLTWALSVLTPGAIVRRLSLGEDALGELVALAETVNGLGAEFAKTPLLDPEQVGSRGPYYDDWLRQPDASQYWHDRAVDRERVAQATPSLNIGGWYDIFLRGTIADFLNATTQDGSVRSRLVIGPWAHGNMTGEFPQHSFGFGSHYQAIDPTGMHLAWFDEHLRDIQANQDEAPVRIFVMGSDEWRVSWSWPLPDTEYRNLYLARGSVDPHGWGHLADEAHGEPDVHELTYDPRDPVPTVGGATFLPGLLVSANAGPMDQRELDQRRDVLRYVTEPLEEDLEVIGPIELVLHVSSDAIDTDFTGKLVDVHPDGRSNILTDGILRARYRDGVMQPAELCLGQTCEIRIDLAATANVFKRGHRIRVDVSSSNFPKFDRNLNTGGVQASGQIAGSVVARNRVHVGPATPSRLVLPVVPRAEAVW